MKAFRIFAARAWTRKRRPPHLGTRYSASSNSAGDKSPGEHQPRRQEPSGRCPSASAVSRTRRIVARPASAKCWGPDTVRPRPGECPRERGSTVPGRSWARKRRTIGGLTLRIPSKRRVAVQSAGSTPIATPLRRHRGATRCSKFAGAHPRVHRACCQDSRKRESVEANRVTHWERRIQVPPRPAQ